MSAEQQVERLNQLLERVAATLLKHEERIAHLEKSMAATAQVVTLQRQALEGHQHMIEALAPSQPHPSPTQGLN